MSVANFLFRAFQDYDAVIALCTLSSAFFTYKNKEKISNRWNWLGYDMYDSLCSEYFTSFSQSMRRVIIAKDSACTNNATIIPDHSPCGLDTK